MPRYILIQQDFTEKNTESLIQEKYKNKGKLKVYYQVIGFTFHIWKGHQIICNFLLLSTTKDLPNCRSLAPLGGQCHAATLGHFLL